jgi:predicted small secreted protein
MNKKTILSIVLLSFVVVGCNTAHGVGQDVENTGHNIKHTVDKND